MFVQQGRSSRSLAILDRVSECIENERDPPLTKPTWPSDVGMDARLNAEWLTDSQIDKVIVEGYCDRRSTFLNNTPPASPLDPFVKGDSLSPSTSNESVGNNPLVECTNVIDLIPINQVPEDVPLVSCPDIRKGSTLADQPLCVAIDIKSLLSCCRTVTNVHLELITDILMKCIVSLVDLPEGEHMTRALTCIRVTQFDSVISQTPPLSAGGVDHVSKSTRPRLLRYHFPMISIHPMEKKQLLNQVASELNDAEGFGIRNWHNHLHSLIHTDDIIPLIMFDWINVSNPCLFIPQKDELSGNWTSINLGYPTDMDLERCFPQYIHEHMKGVTQVLDDLHFRIPFEDPIEDEDEDEDADKDKDGVQGRYVAQKAQHHRHNADSNWLKSLQNECAYLDCECTEEDKLTYESTLEKFHRAFASNPSVLSQSKPVLTGPCPYYPTCPCVCMASRVRISSLLPLVLSNRVRYRLNFSRSSELLVSCNLNKSDIMDMMEMISKSRMEVEEDSLVILRILHTCFSPNSTMGLQLWKQMCWRLDVEPKESISMQLYYTHSDEYHTSSMLQHIAAEDDAAIYTSWKNLRLVAKLRRCIGSMTDTDFAEFVSVYLEGSWVWCPSNKDGKWYHFNKMLWVPEVHEVIPRIISTKVEQHLSKVIDKLSPAELNMVLDSRGQVVEETFDIPLADHDFGSLDADANSRTSSDGGRPGRGGKNNNGRSSTGQGRKNPTTVGERLQKLKEGCKLVCFKNRKLRELKEVMCCQKFESKLDASWDRLAVKDGVILIRSLSVDIERMRMQHMCSMTTNQYLLRHNFTSSHPMVLKVKDWIGKIFPGKDIRNFFWKYMASILYSGNGDKIFMVWAGDGDNSKSMLIKLVQKALGDYCVKLPASMLSEKEGHSTAANPCKAMASKSKLVVFDEPDDAEQLRAAFIKVLSGGDMYFNRDLYEKGRQTKVTFKMIMVCNRVPPIRNPDQAMRNRFVVLPFESIWVDNPPSTKEEQYKQRRFKKDPRFEKNLDTMAPAFLWLMCHEWKHYVLKGLEPKPTDVVKATNDYFNESNLIELYVKDCIEVVDPAPCMLENNPSSYKRQEIIKGKVLYHHYQSWYSNLKSKHTNCMLIGGFQQELKRIIGTDRFFNNNWMGIVMQSEHHSQHSKREKVRTRIRTDRGRDTDTDTGGDNNTDESNDSDVEEALTYSQNDLGVVVRSAVNRNHKQSTSLSGHPVQLGKHSRTSLGNHSQTIKKNRDTQEVDQSANEFHNEASEDSEDNYTSDDDDDDDQEESSPVSQRMKQCNMKQSRSALTSGFYSGEALDDSQLVQEALFEI